MPPFMQVDPNRGSGRFCWGPNQPNLSNEAIVLAPIDGATYPKGFPAGTIIAKITAAGGTLGQYGPYDPAANDGRQLTTGLGVLWHDAPASAAAQKNVIVARHQIVNANLVTYVAAVNDAQKAAAEAGFAVNQVIFRH